MARGGVTRTEVMRARDTLRAKGENPSIDAVRVVLGNTGSKATIHRHLKALEEADGLHADRSQYLTENLNQLVASLAAQLQEDAQSVIEAAESRHQIAMTNAKTRETTLTKELAEQQQQLSVMSEQFDQSERDRLTAGAELQALKLKTERLEQQLINRDELIQQKDMYSASLEEKHQHARQALEHYRESIKDLREQDQRRHESQIQQLQAELRQLAQNLSIKQNDITQLNNQNGSLTTELRSLRGQFSKAESATRRLETQYQLSQEQLVISKEQQAESKRNAEASQQTLIDLKLQLKGKKKELAELITTSAIAKSEMALKDLMLEKLMPQAPSEKPDKSVEP